MRITSKMMTGSIAENLYRQAEQILRSQKAVATGKRIQRVSDDPVGLGKVLAYRRAADNILSLGQDIRTYWQAGTLQEIPGIGPAIADKIDELSKPDATLGLFAAYYLNSIPSIILQVAPLAVL